MSANKRTLGRKSLADNRHLCLLHILLWWMWDWWEWTVLFLLSNWRPLRARTTGLRDRKPVLLVQQRSDGVPPPRQQARGTQTCGRAAHCWLYLDSVWQRGSLLNFFHLCRLLALDVLLDHYAWLSRQNLHLYEKRKITYSTDLWWDLSFRSWISQEAWIAMNIRFSLQSTLRYKNIIFLLKQNS